MDRSKSYLMRWILLSAMGGGGGGGARRREAERGGERRGRRGKGRELGRNETESKERWGADI